MAVLWWVVGVVIPKTVEALLPEELEVPDAKPPEMRLGTDASNSAGRVG